MKSPNPGQQRTGLIYEVRGRASIVALLAFCIALAFVFASLGQPLVDELLNWISGLMTRPANGANPEPVVQERFRSAPTTVIPLALLGFVTGAIIGSRFVRAMERLGMQWDQMEVGDKVTLFVGIFAGLIASFPLIQIFQFFPMDAAMRVTLIIAITVGLGALSVYALQSMADILPWNRGRSRTRRSGIKILDTNVLIDGRIADVAKTGFLEGQLYVPKFVLEELQFIADSHDSLRRQRGRRGLEVLKHMQHDFPIEIGTQDKLLGDTTNEEVDARIVRLAKALGGDIVTNDFNLNRVASLQNIRVLSLNDLALSLRTNVLPQESLHLRIIREGNQAGQGIGYLEDGTMVVVENGQPYIGETTDVAVTQVIQTERGKMVFAEVAGGDEVVPRRRTGPRRNTA